MFMVLRGRLAVKGPEQLLADGASQEAGGRAAMLLLLLLSTERDECQALN
jgi:hypothetical protein